MSSNGMIQMTERSQVGSSPSSYSRIFALQISLNPKRGVYRILFVKLSVQNLLLVRHNLQLARRNLLSTISETKSTIYYYRDEIYHLLLARQNLLN